MITTLRLENQPANQRSKARTKYHQKLFQREEEEELNGGKQEWKYTTRDTQNQDLKGEREKPGT